MSGDFVFNTEKMHDLMTLMEKNREYAGQICQILTRTMHLSNSLDKTQYQKLIDKFHFYEQLYRDIFQATEEIRDDIVHVSANTAKAIERAYIDMKTKRQAIEGDLLL